MQRGTTAFSAAQVKGHFLRSNVKFDYFGISVGYFIYFVLTHCVVLLCFTVHRLQIEGFANIHERASYVLLPLFLLGGVAIETFEIIWNTFLFYLCPFDTSVVVLDNLCDIDGKLGKTAKLSFTISNTLLCCIFC